MDKKLWYEKEAMLWEEALPIGNGRMGAMAYCGVISDKLQINEDTLWSGYPGREKRKHSLKELEPIRKLVNEKKYKEAETAVSDIMFGFASESYVPYGNIHIDIRETKRDVKDYRRELDMETAIVKTSYKLNDMNIEKEVFVSFSDDVLVYHIKSDKDCEISVYQSVELENSVHSDNDVVMVEGRCPTNVSMYTNTVEYKKDEESIHFCSCSGFVSEGHIYSGGNYTHQAGEDITFVFSLKTSFNGYDKMPVTQGKEYKDSSLKAFENAKKYSYEELKARHIAEYKKYFDRVSVKIEGEDFDDIPTDKRIENAANGTVDNSLVTLLFDFGRYLTISSSMPGTQPTNLQGIWNYRMIAPWHSNYTMNINTQMNYWPTETCNLPEFHMPLIKMLKEFSEKGNNFGLRGWSSWHNSDIWRFNYEATKGVLWGFWQMGGFWSVRHIWEHYLHTRDKEFLKEYYPVMTGAAEFLEDWMFEKDGYLTTCPSTSPENRFVCGDETSPVCEGGAMDMEIIHDLFDKTIKASEILGEDSSHYKEIFSKLKPVKIGKDGRILEWGEELLESELGHRHISHLYGFFPADIMNDKKYEDAARETLRVRLENGGGHTGWSNAWIANVYARLHEGENVMKHIRNMFKKSIYPNMFDAHPPFQIDGNFGICAAICEALMQSHKGEVELIPAIPAEWKKGEVIGFKSRTGETVSFKWENNKAKRI